MSKIGKAFVYNQYLKYFESLDESDFIETNIDFDGLLLCINNINLKPKSEYWSYNISNNDNVKLFRKLIK